MVRPSLPKKPSSPANPNTVHRLDVLPSPILLPRDQAEHNADTDHIAARSVPAVVRAYLAGTCVPEGDAEARDMAGERGY